jgi:hypothetical protein
MCLFHLHHIQRFYTAAGGHAALEFNTHRFCLSISGIKKATKRVRHNCGVEYDYIPIKSIARQVHISIGVLARLAVKPAYGI